MGKPTLKPIHDQVVVITGASSGIGREASLLFAEQRAAIVPIARSEDDLASLAQEIERFGGRAHPIVADVTDWDAMQSAADEAAETFGRIDTWVNNAAVSLYGTVDELDVNEMRRVIDVILMGQIHGMKAALPHLEREGRGALINVASALSKRSVPLQAAYCAAKHGVKGFTESLRLELEHAGSGVSVTLILPASMNTPLFEHARSKLDRMPQPIPPIYEPRVTAEAILFAAEHRRREIVAGGAGKILTVLERISPELADRYMLFQGQAFDQQKSDRPDLERDNLYRPIHGTGRSVGKFGGKSKSRSLYTTLLEQHPGRKRLLALGALAGVALLLFGAGRSTTARPHRKEPEAQRIGGTSR